MRLAFILAVLLVANSPLFAQSQFCGSVWAIGVSFEDVGNANPGEFIPVSPDVQLLSTPELEGLSIDADNRTIQISPVDFGSPADVRVISQIPDFQFQSLEITTVPTPEPSTVVLGGFALALYAGFRRLMR